MTNRLITKLETPSGQTIIRVVFNSDWEEYQCKVAINGMDRSRLTYYTNDKADALATAKVMALSL